jgi:putative flavoprotein involved in K+ transport
MSVEEVEVLVVGGGQAGVAMSEHLGVCGVPHLVLERGRIAESWRTARWDSLVANGPAWHDRFPNMTYKGYGPDDFPSKEAVADYFADYAKMIEAPIRCGVEVIEVRRHEGRPGFRVTTSEGEIHAEAVVAATGPFQRPIIPPVVPEEAGITQIHSHHYRNPGQLPEGAALVVGAGSSGAQIADELQRAGRRVFLSVGPHERPPRGYRGRDLVWWVGVLGLWDLETPGPGTEHITISVSGAYGGRTIDFRELAHQGTTLVGQTASYADGKLLFAPGTWPITSRAATPAS